MGIENPTPPFTASHYDAAPGIGLALLKPFEAAQIGVMLASMDPWARYPVSAAKLTAFFKATEPGSPRFAIRVDGQLEGALAVKANWFCGPYIQIFGLAPMSQGRGVGSAILAFIERQARAAGDRNLWVAASDFNARALAFYERSGFARVAAIDGLLQDGQTEILLRKPLPPPLKHIV